MPSSDDADEAAVTTAVTVTPRADGPLVVDGPVGLTRPDGTVEPAQRLFLCRCGHSADKPSCDGSHKRVGFSAPGVPVARKPGRP
ncbi:CDGSH iron-sulfur domain-containing protein [Aquihabitans sp. G128]|uniref:CDGSH iron-sulfur domain-containing protein n=1 Tax=Aquihabitans sp. G128 TaxID=2849779 RepID=UPI001C227668|nr:CDGSH iron-sulfur domain-containing protein [Aquihabitans sp. G128]QXC60339.1 CDGSH iron-sulfur domain-containing protein [Aquihabitans sp. G128]